jgi:putative ABC transport system substrate-binding protein
MRRREFITLLGGAVVFALLRGASAQVPKRQPIVAVLSGASPGTASRYVAGLTERMWELGYSPGLNVDLVYRYADGDLARLPALVDELISLKPDVLVASNTQAAITMRRATVTVPIVAASFTDPVGFGLVASHARPGGNVTGILATVDTLPEKLLALLAEAVRGAVKIGILVNPSFQADAVMRQGAETAATTLGIKLMPVAISLPEELDAAFQWLAREHVEGVLVPQDPLFLNERQRIGMLAIAARLPTMFGYREHVEAGGLMSYGVDLRANFRRAADLVDGILKGAAVTDLPVELPTKFELVINLKTAKVLGIDVPVHLQQLADEVIE